MSYDRAITVFSPDGHLFQVEYALEAVKSGAVALGVCGKDQIVLGFEKKNLQHLELGHTVRKIVQIDEHLTLALSGLAPDARMLIQRARVKCQSHRLTYEEPMSVLQCARYIAELQQQFTVKGGRRPFGVSTIIAGFDKDGSPRLFITDPSGVFSEWKAAAIGRSQQSVTSVLESLYFEDEPLKEAQRADLPQTSLVSSTQALRTQQNKIDPIQIAARTLGEIVDRNEKGMDLIVLTPDNKRTPVPKEVIIEHLQTWKQQKEEQAKFGRTYQQIVLDGETR